MAREAGGGLGQTHRVIQTSLNQIFVEKRGLLPASEREVELDDVKRWLTICIL